MNLYVIHTRISFAAIRVCAKTLFYSKKRAITREGVDLDTTLRSIFEKSSSLKANTYFCERKG